MRELGMDRRTKGANAFAEAHRPKTIIPDLDIDQIRIDHDPGGDGAAQLLRSGSF